MDDINPLGENSIGDYYDNYKQNQLHLIRIYSRKARNSIFAMAGLWLASDVLGLMAVNIFTIELLFSACLVPVIFVAIAFLALTQPMAAAVIAAVVFLGVWVLTILIFGSAGAISGLLIKAIVIYFLISSFQSAREVNRIKKEIV
ncbi:MAG TPA: hypothetical protein VGI82_13900 [Chitinophagaceae bacterium]